MARYRKSHHHKHNVTNTNSAPHPRIADGKTYLAYDHASQDNTNQNNAIQADQQEDSLSEMISNLIEDAIPTIDNTNQNNSIQADQQEDYFSAMISKLIKDSATTITNIVEELPETVVAHLDT